MYKLIAILPQMPVHFPQDAGQVEVPPTSPLGVFLKRTSTGVQSFPREFERGLHKRARPLFGPGAEALSLNLPVFNVEHRLREGNPNESHIRSKIIKQNRELLLFGVVPSDFDIDTDCDRFAKDLPSENDSVELSNLDRPTPAASRRPPITGQFTQVSFCVINEHEFAVQKPYHNVHRQNDVKEYLRESELRSWICSALIQMQAFRPQEGLVYRQLKIPALINSIADALSHVRLIVPVYNPADLLEHQPHDTQSSVLTGVILDILDTWKAQNRVVWVDLYPRNMLKNGTLVDFIGKFDFKESSELAYRIIHLFQKSALSLAAIDTIKSELEKHISRDSTASDEMKVKFSRILGLISNLKKR